MRHVPEVRHTPVVAALIEASSRLEDAGAIRKLVNSALTATWTRVSPAELAALLTTAQGWVQQEAPAALAPGWQWNWAELQAVLARAAKAPQLLSVVSVAGAIRRSLDEREYHVATSGADPWDDDRGVTLDVLARLLEATAPQPWELPLLNRAANHAIVLPAGVRIRHLREALGLSQAVLALKVGVHRSTVIRWETGTRHPPARHREALARVLGGHPADYDGDG
jgi:DNA-binding transcriptional regulator YiaG